MDTAKSIKHVIMTEYWGEVITFFVVLTVMFAMIRALFGLLGQ